MKEKYSNISNKKRTSALNKNNNQKKNSTSKLVVKKKRKEIMKTKNMLETKLKYITKQRQKKRFRR